MQIGFLEISYSREDADSHSLDLFNPSKHLIYNIDIYIINQEDEKYHFWISNLLPKTGKTIFLTNNPGRYLWHFQGDVKKIEIESQGRKQTFFP